MAPRPWLRDWTDTEIGRTAFATAYMYVATVVPTVAFGGLLQSVTCDRIGITETMLAQGLIGVIFALIGGNGVAILRPSGPVVAFISIIYSQAIGLHLEFFDLYGWVCTWLGIFLMLFAIADLSYLIRFVTEFTEEVFSALISVIFMYEAGKHAFGYVFGGSDADVSHDATVSSVAAHHDTMPSTVSAAAAASQTAVFSLVLLLLAHWIALSGENFRTSRYLGPRARAAYFVASGVLAIAIPTALAALTRGRFWDTTGTDNSGADALEMLDVPAAIFQPTALSCTWDGVATTVPNLCPANAANITAAAAATTAGHRKRAADILVGSNSTAPVIACTARSWVISWWSAPPAAVGYGAIFGLLLATLFFVEQNITQVLMQAPANRLTKHIPLHYDLFIVGALCVLCGVLGIPVAHVCLPHSLLHVHALAAQEEHVGNDGHVQRHVLRVCETRVSALAANALILITVCILPLLTFVPLATLFGFFLFMGYSSLRHNPLWVRALLAVTDSHRYPPQHIVRRLRRWKVHLYTALQLAWLAVILACKLNHDSAPFFPILVIAMVPFRALLLPFVFTPPELRLLDGGEESHKGDRKHGKKT